MRTDRRLVGALLVSAMLLAACGAAATAPADSETSMAPAPGDGPSTTPAAQPTTPSTTPAPQPTTPSTTAQPVTSQPAMGESQVDDTTVTTAPPIVTKPTVTTSGAPGTTSPSGDAPIPVGMESMVADAKDDLAARLESSVSEIRLVRAEYFVWPDSSIGCPQPGMAYTQVQVDGARVVLGARSVEYHYHKGGLDPVFYCATA